MALHIWTCVNNATVSLYALVPSGKFHFCRNFQFIWMGEKDTIDSITMMDVATPCLVLLDPQTHNYYLPNFAMKDLTISSLTGFLNNVTEGKSPVRKTVDMSLCTVVSANQTT